MTKESSEKRSEESHPPEIDKVRSLVNNIFANIYNIKNLIFSINDIKFSSDFRRFLYNEKVTQGAPKMNEIVGSRGFFY
jgi:hypothetical protein